MHIRFSGDEQSGIWFLKADSQEQQALLGKQTGGQPTLVIYTDDCKGLYDHVKTNGVTIIEPMETAGGSMYFYCADLWKQINDRRIRTPMSHRIFSRSA
ncbi:hypothetical protein [Chitinophaga sp. HK235]|uniref:hypothetical protein n=1 Tax=Chitinophaga sp. HK235 TaxID=2952571 RepID=UPI001BA58803|nr:hypothetical protein [Chitinophaga sp. HK235]